MYFYGVYTVDLKHQVYIFSDNQGKKLYQPQHYTGGKWQAYRHVGEVVNYCTLDSAVRVIERSLGLDHLPVSE